ncbi:hypothetical protein [Arcicella lustrica]|uniref:Uncharacterized protein n=1 Tax=Arcicella lustrica TaxID=2984196 RepID=A0ABU5SET8_9BACT|nr:hypothetical protein [Arcicella sp. DC25W]MEA5425788.1 hypothetical protein [Arcicella sp. DC25W]
MDTNNYLPKDEFAELIFGRIKAFGLRINEGNEILKILSKSRKTTGELLKKKGIDS